jgi:hypothetical protein
LNRFCRDLFDKSDDKSLKTLRVWNNIHFKYLYMDFGNSHIDTMVIIGLRIAYAFFIEKEYVIKFRKFCLKIETSGCDIDLLMLILDIVLIYIREFLKISNGQQLFLFIHIDN